MDQDRVSARSGARLDGKVLLITGAGNGIGSAVARVAAAEGARLALLDYDGDAVATAAAAIGGKDVLAIPADVTEIGKIDAIVDQVVARFGKLDVLANIAGVMDLFAPVEEVTPEIWDRIFSVNVRAVAFLMQSALKHMLPAGSGSIVNMASTAGLKAGGGGSPYAAAKGAVISLTRQAAHEVGSRGVRVNAVAPGATETNFLQSSTKAIGTVGPQAQQFLAEAGDAYGRSITLGRYARAAEIAQATVFLASDEASYITGTVLVVDGGATV